MTSLYQKICGGNILAGGISLLLLNFYPTYIYQRIFYNIFGLALIIGAILIIYGKRVLGGLITEIAGINSLYFVLFGAIYSLLLFFLAFFGVLFALIFGIFAFFEEQELTEDPDENPTNRPIKNYVILCLICMSIPIISWVLAYFLQPTFTSTIFIIVTTLLVLSLVLFVFIHPDQEVFWNTRWTQRHGPHLIGEWRWGKPWYYFSFGLSLSIAIMFYITGWNFDLGQLGFYVGLLVTSFFCYLLMKIGWKYHTPLRRVGDKKVIPSKTASIEIGAAKILMGIGIGFYIVGLILLVWGLTLPYPNASFAISGIGVGLFIPGSVFFLPGVTKYFKYRN